VCLLSYSMSDAEGAAVNNAAAAYKERMKVEIDEEFLYNS